jgi:hypothetical protein
MLAIVAAQAVCRTALGRNLMRSGNIVRASFIAAGLFASLMFGLAACSTTDEGDSMPAGEEMFGGDNRDEAPAHQEKARENR